MSFGASAATPHTPKERHPFALDPQKTSTNERAKPVPYFAGTRRLGVTWLGPAYNQRTEEVTETSDSGGGKFGGGGSQDQTVGQDYFADCAALVCLGAVDALHEVFMDQDRVWRGEVKRVEGVHSAAITIEDRGNMRIYWGTDAQPIDGILGAHGHPAYRGQCYVVFEQLYFGQDRTSAPNVELTLARQPEMSVGGERWIGSDVNPIHVAAEWLTNQRWGLGLVWTALDLAQLANVSGAIAGEKLGISPLLPEQVTARDGLLKLSEYVDGWPRFLDGKFQIKLNRLPSTNVRSYPLIGEYDLVEPATWGSEPWNATINQVAVTFTDRFARYESDVQEWNSPAAEAIVGEPIRETLDRPWACTQGMAYRLASYFGLMHSVPLLTGRLRVRRSLVDDELGRRGDEIKAGGWVRFTSAALQQTLLLRVVRKIIPDDRAQMVDLEVETDRYYAAVLAYTPDDVPGPDRYEETPRQLLAGRVIELPRELVADDMGSENLKRPHFSALAVRRSKLDVRVKVRVSEDGAEYQRLILSSKFARYGRLAAPLPIGREIDETASIVLDVPVEMVDRDWINTATERGWWLGNKLAFVGNEIIAFRSTTVLSATQVRLNGIIRRRFGDVIENHAAGAEVFVVRRRAVHGSTLATIEADDEVRFKMAGGTRWGFFPESEIAAQTMTVRNLTARPLGPANLIVNGSRSAPFTFEPGGDVFIKWYGRHVNSHGLWHSFDDPYRPSGLDHRVKVFNGAGDLVWFSKVRDARRVEEEDGKFKLTIENAFLLSLFDGVEPHHFTIRISAKARGLVSVTNLAARIVRSTSSAVSWGTGTLCWQPSGLFRLAGCTNPEILLQANFTSAAAHFSATLPHPDITGLDARQARRQSAQNFAALASATGLMLYDVLNGQGRVTPAVQSDANFEILNGLW